MNLISPVDDEAEVHAGERATGPSQPKRSPTSDVISETWKWSEHASAPLFVCIQCGAGRLPSTSSIVPVRRASVDPFVGYPRGYKLS